MTSFREALEKDAALRVTAARLLGALIQYADWDSVPDEGTPLTIRVLDRNVVVNYIFKGVPPSWEWRVHTDHWHLVVVSSDPVFYNKVTVLGADLTGDRELFERDAVLFILSVPEQ